LARRDAAAQTPLLIVCLERRIPVATRPHRPSRGPRLTREQWLALQVEQAPKITPEQWRKTRAILRQRDIAELE
jgi:hypothetical protein